MGSVKRLRCWESVPMFAHPRGGSGVTADKAEMAMEPTADGAPTLDIGTDADLLLRHIRAKVALRRARRLAMRDGHPLTTVRDRRQRDDDGLRPSVIPL